MSALRARYFDGRSAAATEVRLLPLPGQVWVQGQGVERREPLSAVDIGERLGRAPRLIRFADGAHCEVPEDAALEAWLEIVGHRARLVDRAQRSGLVALVAVVGVLLSAAAGYRWGLPLAAEQLAHRVPEVVTRELSTHTLAFLDEGMLKDSTLDAARRAALEAGFRRLDPAGEAQLLFRAAPAMGPNAMALPDGRIVLLDELVALAQHDEEILAVLAHELGHVRERHGLRLMIQGTAVAAFIAWWIGDFSPLIAAAPVALLQARHSRALESEADAEAARMLRTLGIAPARLADMLERIAAAHHLPAGEDDADRVRDYLSSHPAPGARIRALRELR